GSATRVKIRARFEASAIQGSHKVFQSISSNPTAVMSGGLELAVDARSMGRPACSVSWRSGEGCASTVNFAVFFALVHLRQVLRMRVDADMRLGCWLRDHIEHPLRFRIRFQVGNALFCGI